MIRVKLYGQPTSTYEYVKMMMVRRAEKAGIDLQVEEINDLERIIEEELESIPTIKVNDHIDLRYHKNDDINVFVRELTTQILKEENFGLMKKMIVPTDFSETSENACAYAMGLAKDLNGVVTIVHSYIPKALNMEGAVYIDPEIENLRREQLDNFVEQLNHSFIGEAASEPLIQKKFVTGFAGKEIPDLIREEEEPIVVIGSTGSGGSLKTIFGSVSTMIAKDAQCPVFVIPPNASYGSISKIAYAADNPEVDDQVIEDLLKFSKAFGAELHLVHIDRHDDDNVLERLEEKCKEKSCDTVIEKHHVSSETIVDGLNHFIEEKDIDLLILTKKKRTFIDNLFHASVTRRMTINTKIPLLVLHR